MRYKFVRSVCLRHHPFPRTLKKITWFYPSRPPGVKEERKPHGPGEEVQLSGEGLSSLLPEKLWNGKKSDERGF